MITFSGPSEDSGFRGLPGPPGPPGHDGMKLHCLRGGFPTDPAPEAKAHCG